MNLVLIAVGCTALAANPTTTRVPSPSLPVDVDGALVEWQRASAHDVDGVELRFAGGREDSVLFVAARGAARRVEALTLEVRVPGLAAEPLASYDRGVAQPAAPCDVAAQAPAACRLVPNLPALSSRTFSMRRVGAAVTVEGSDSLAKLAGFPGCCRSSRAAVVAGRDLTSAELVITAEDLPPTTATRLAELEVTVRVGDGPPRTFVVETTPLTVDRVVATAFEAAPLPMLFPPVRQPPWACWKQTGFFGVQPELKCAAIPCAPALAAAVVGADLVRSVRRRENTVSDWSARHLGRGGVEGGVDARAGHRASQRLEHLRGLGLGADRRVLGRQLR